MQLAEFFRLLDRHQAQVPLGELVRLMQQLEISRADVADVVCFAEGKYKRNVLRVGSGYAALILCWKDGQASPVHDHRGSACGVRVLDGEVSETQYDRADDGTLSERCVKRYPLGAVCGSYDSDIHMIGNEQGGGRELITLHIYTPPMRNYHIYDLDTGAVTTCDDVETLEAQRALAAQSA